MGDSVDRLAALDGLLEQLDLPGVAVPLFVRGLGLGVGPRTHRGSGPVAALGRHLTTSVGAAGEASLNERPTNVTSETKIAMRRM
jgi:hypothetical protein